ncbi:MAG: aminoacyl-tRNA hydrolase [Phycisphaerae bacterium]|nr:aminoacyl-tRNA hydrolase [Phycisphaerae bacterium]
MFAVSEDKLKFRFSRSGGPGGQNVNKLSTRVEVLYDIESSDDLNQVQKQLVRKRLAKRINSDGFLSVTCQEHRSQNANRVGAVAKMNELIGWSLRRAKVRKKTKMPFSAKLKRLDEKKKRSKIKTLRTQKHFEE